MKPGKPQGQALLARETKSAARLYIITYRQAEA